MTELKFLYHALLKIKVEDQHLLVQLKDGQIECLAFLKLNASLTSAYMFWCLTTLFLFLLL
jgi:hypothetical protein